jgi:hypothetical protein
MRLVRTSGLLKDQWRPVALLEPLAKPLANPDCRRHPTRNSPDAIRTRAEPTTRTRLPATAAVPKHTTCHPRDYPLFPLILRGVDVSAQGGYVVYEGKTLSEYLAIPNE